MLRRPWVRPLALLPAAVLGWGVFAGDAHAQTPSSDGSETRAGVVQPPESGGELRVEPAALGGGPSPEALFLAARHDADAAATDYERLVRQETAAYCEHLTAAQRSEAAQLRSPWLSARGLTLQRGELASSGRAVDPRIRLGLGFSLSDWFRAGLVEERGQGGCALYEAEAQLRPTTSDVEALTVEAWKAKAELLSAAVVEAQELLRRSDAQLSASERTVAEHLALLADYQSLVQKLSQAEMQVAKLAVTSAPARLRTSKIEALRRSAAELERVEGALRRNRSFSIDVEGGYDEIVHTPQQLPVYGQVNVTFRPGYLWQTSADAVSETARGRAAGLRAEAEQRRFGETLAQVTARTQPLKLQLERQRRILGLLEEKYSTLSQVARPDAQHLSERLWFQLQVQRAELRHLEVALGDLEAWLASASNPGQSSGAPTQPAARLESSSTSTTPSR